MTQIHDFPLLAAHGNAENTTTRGKGLDFALKGYNRFVSCYQTSSTILFMWVKPSPSLAGDMSTPLNSMVVWRPERSKTTRVSVTSSDLICQRRCRDVTSEQLKCHRLIILRDTVIWSVKHDCTCSQCSMRKWKCKTLTEVHSSHMKDVFWGSTCMSWCVMSLFKKHAPWFDPSAHSMCTLQSAC